MEFLETCVSFPVAIYSGALIIAALYWLVAAFGILDIDSLDLDVDPGGGDFDIGGDLDLGGDLDVGGDMDLGDMDVGGDLEAGDAGDVSHHAPVGGGMGVFASLMFQLGLYGVPMTLILTFIALFGWIISYYGFHLGLGVFFEPGLLRYGLGVGLMAMAFVLASFLTSLIIKPLRPLFKKEEQVTGASIRGRTVVIRSTQVTGTYGEAIYEDGKAGMLLDVRPANQGETFKRGDKAVLLDYDAERRIYTIVSEDEFRGR